MEINIFILSDNILMGKKNCPSYIEQKCINKGFFVKKKVILPSYQPDLCELLIEEKDCLNIILVENEMARVNESLCKLTNDEICSNDKIKQVVLDFYKFRNLPFEKFASSQWEIPSRARAIICENSPYQGYIIKGERNDIVVLSLDNFKPLFDVVYDNVWISSAKCNIFKTFGLNESNLKKLIGEYFKNKDGIKIYYSLNDLETDIFVKGKKEDKVEEYCKNIYSRISKFVYAESDINIFNVAYEILKANNLTISFAESVTGGNLAGNFIKNNPGASSVIKQSFVTYSDQAKKDLLGVSDITLKDKGAVSSQTAYEMAIGLLKKGCDIAVATTGYAGDNTGENYIAIGDKNAVHVYKNIFCMSRENAIDNLCKAGNFYLIKKLRSNDFYFDKSNV